MDADHDDRSDDGEWSRWTSKETENEDRASGLKRAWGLAWGWRLAMKAEDDKQDRNERKSETKTDSRYVWK